MGFFRSIVTLVACTLSIGFAYAVGHGLSVHSVTPFIVGAIMLLAGAALIFALTRERGPARW
jgi:hypothetical protein